MPTPIIDFLLSIGMRPFVELSFMPTALASGAATVFSYRGNVTPPRRLPGLGRPDSPARSPLGGALRPGRGAALVLRGVERAQPASVLGRHPAGVLSSCIGTRSLPSREWTPACAWAVRPPPRTPGSRSSSTSASSTGLPADFVSTHHYPNDPLWSAAQDTESELAGGRRGILREWAAAWRDGRRGAVPLLYTEWNASSNPRYPRQDESYAAAFAVKTVLEASGLVEAYSFWTFTDIFEENYFPSVPFHGGFGSTQPARHPQADAIAPSSCCTGWATSSCPLRKEPTIRSMPGPPCGRAG